MYVVLLEYTAPKSEIDTYLPERSDWVARHYAAGDFMVVGHRESLASDTALTGGVILARAMSRGRLEAILATDPFAVHRLARHDVIEFQALRTIPELAHYADRLATQAT